jgi:hypothetical protein
MTTATSCTASEERYRETHQQVVREPDFSLNYSCNDTQRAAFWSDIGRSSSLSFVLLTSLVLSSIWLASGLSWLYDMTTKTSPILSCPRLAAYDVYSDAKYCKVTLSTWSTQTYFSILQNDRYALTEEAAKIGGRCLLPSIDPDMGPYEPNQQPIVCFSSNPCYDTTDWYPLNPYSVSSLDNHAIKGRCSLVVGGMLFQVPCFEIFNAEPYCDSGFNVQPTMIIAIRGLILGLLALYLIMVTHDIVRALRIYGLNETVKKFKGAVLAKTVPVTRYSLMQRCLLKWNTLISRTNSGVSQPVTPSSSSSPKAVPFHPVLSPRKSFAFKSKDSPVGYSPRMDSPPVHVISTINRTTSRLTRAHGAVEVMFATTWKKRVAKYFKTKAKVLRGLRLPNMRRLVHVVVAVLFFCGLYTLLFRLVMFLVAQLPITGRLPGNLSLGNVIGLKSDRTGSVMQVLGWDLSANNVIKQRVVYTWVSFLAFLDVALEAATLLIFAVIALLKPTKVHTVPKNPLKRVTSGDDLHPHVSVRPLKDRIQATPETSMNDDSFEDAYTGEPNRFQIPHKAPLFIPRSRRESLTTSSVGNLEFPVMDDSVLCIMMSVMSPCATEEGRRLFVDQLQSLRSLVEHDRDIFVIDCGVSRSPIDDTESVIYDEVSDKIHYVYYPEPNRLVSLYWTSKYWIPFLFTSNLCGDYIYSLILEGESGICFPPDFELPSSEFLLGNPEIKAMYIPVSEKPGFVHWSERLRERIHLTWISNVLRSSTHAGGYGVPQIWERNSFEMTCFNLPACTNADPNTYRSLSLKSNGRMLLRDRCKSRMISWLPHNGAKPVLGKRVWIPEQRDYGFLANMRELIEPPSLLHATSVLSKSAVFGEIFNASFDSIRVFLITCIVLRDPVGLAVVAILMGYLAMLPLAVNLLVSIRYEDHVVSKLFFLLFVQPFAMLLVELPRRTVRLFKQKLIPVLFRRYESDVTIGEREEQLLDLAIVPPHPVPHWPTVWT